jgi:hypothetical protein
MTCFGARSLVIGVAHAALAALLQLPVQHVQKFDNSG